MSPSSRRAWIEIISMSFAKAFFLVALLAEGVDRNNHAKQWATRAKTSPSSRRAWIEIPLSGLAQQSGGGRPPRGGRG